jgi:hypothetical protein
MVHSFGITIGDAIVIGLLVCILTRLALMSK